MAICRKPKAGIVYIHEEQSWRDPVSKKVKCRTVLVGKVLRDTGEDWFYPEYHEGLLGIAKGKFHSVKKLREYQKRRPQGYKIWRLARLAKIAAGGADKADAPSVTVGKSPDGHIGKSDGERMPKVARGDRSQHASEMAKRLLILFENIVDFVSYMSDINQKDKEKKINSQERYGSNYQKYVPIGSNKLTNML
ncbi:MAG: hypothetical protein LBR22_06575 [Desulfovibrio sp.]|nr:hypothetical protein [Desulfovibrio sp.]